MKRILFPIIIFVMLFLPSAVKGDYFGDFEYIRWEKGIDILSYKGTDKQVLIPLQIEQTDVIRIAPSAFEGNTYIEQVIMPSAIEVIGSRAFAGCTGLNAINISAGLKTIGEEAFADCVSLYYFTLPASLETIGRRAFSGCVNLSYIQDLTTDLLQRIGSGAFDDTTWFKSFIGDYVSIGQGNFLLKYIGAETELILPWNYFYIAEDAFSGNDTIRRLQLPNYLRGLQSGSISDMSSLETVMGECIPNFIDDGAFRNLPNLNTVHVINSIELNSDHFYNCPFSPYGSEDSSPYDISIPDDSDARFLSAYSDDLEGVVILYCYESAVDAEGVLEFPERIRKKKVVSIGPGACQNREDIKKVIFPKYLKSIESWAFAYDYNLSEIMLPERLEHIAADAFNSCNISTDQLDLENVDVDPRAFYQVPIN